MTAHLASPDLIVAHERTVYFTVSGRVQGVGFRYFAQETARRLQLKGYVRNSKEGRVEGVACGTPENLERFQESIKKGPAMARVVDLQVGPAPPFSGDSFDVVN